MPNIITYFINEFKHLYSKIMRTRNEYVFYLLLKVKSQLIDNQEYYTKQIQGHEAIVKKLVSEGDALRREEAEAKTLDATLTKLIEGGKK